MIYGKLAQAVLYKNIAPQTVTQATATTLYNGGQPTTVASGWDTKGFEELNVVINVGALTGGVTNTITLVESDTDNMEAGLASGAVTAVTSASFNALTTLTPQVASIRTIGTKRYIWVKEVIAGTAGTVSYGITGILGKADVGPQDNSLVFDLLGDNSNSQA